MVDKSLLALGALLFLAFIASIGLLLSAEQPVVSPASNPVIAGAGNLQNQNPPLVVGGVQDVYVRALDAGRYDKQEITVKAGIPVRMHFSADSNSGCGRQIVLPDFKLNAISSNGEEKILEFTPSTPGSYAYRCGMNMFRGVLKVV